MGLPAIALVRAGPIAAPIHARRDPLSLESRGTIGMSKAAEEELGTVENRHSHDNQR